MMLSYVLDRFFIKKPRLREFVTAMMVRNRNLDVNVAGATLRINSRREHGYFRASRLIRRNVTLRDELPVLMNLFALIRDGDTFVDVGANAGLYTHSMWRLTQLYPRFKIVAIEAHPDTFSRLSSRKLDRVTYLNVAISDKAGDVDFVDGAVSHVFTSLDKMNSYSIPGRTYTVPGMRLDDLDMDSESIVLKIDVEGQESRVLDGASKLLANGSVRAVYLDGYDDPCLHDRLAGLGFELFEGRTLCPITCRTFSLLALRGR
ncbi:MAG: FkbM family methyltransferase [Pirellulaceae bacterium]